jgi:hypothetical protein
MVSVATTMPSTIRSTLATPTLSLALASTVTAPPSTAPSAGEVMVAVGGVVSLPSSPVAKIRSSASP